MIVSDIAKWALLVAGALALIGLILALPFAEFLNVGELSTAISNVVSVAGSSFGTVRGLLNNFLLPFGRDVLSGLLVYFFCKWIITIGIKITAWIYHFIFK